MPYLSPNFANDIFLSYARVDNESANPDEGWVDFFKKSLEIQLSKLIGDLGVINIWMDTRRIASNHYFGDEIEKQIKDSGLFLALTSRGYLHPDSYCRKELKAFHSYAQRTPEGLRIGTRSRIFNGLLYNIPHTEWPEEYRGLSGAPLYDPDKPDLGDPSSITSELFRSQVRELAGEIFKSLSEYKNCCSQPAPPPPPQTRSLKVFLADTSESLSEVRTCVLNKLNEEGVAVFDRIPPPYAVTEHDQAATEQIAAADLSVHLFDATPGDKLIKVGSSKTFLQRQAELGLEHAKSQFIWMPPKALVDIPTIKDDSYRALLSQLESGERDKSRYTFQREPASGVSDAIVNRIRSLARVEPPVRSSAALLETHPKDQLHALELYPLLLERSLQPYINPDQEEPSKSFGDFEKMIQQVSVLIIIFGTVASEWVKERLVSSLQLAGTLEPLRLRLCGIYAPPGIGEVDRQVSLGPFPSPVPIVVFDDRRMLAQILDLLLGGGR